ncbi:hypothetical protein HK101_004821, partial [Irineochytrium annulatum]
MNQFYYSRGCVSLNDPTMPLHGRILAVPGTTILSCAAACYQANLDSILVSATAGCTCFNIGDNPIHPGAGGVLAGQSSGD